VIVPRDPQAVLSEEQRADLRTRWPSSHRALEEAKRRRLVRLEREIDHLLEERER
jgi:hypothetical protein